MKRKTSLDFLVEEDFDLWSTNCTTSGSRTSSNYESGQSPLLQGSPLNNTSLSVTGIHNVRGGNQENLFTLDDIHFDLGTEVGMNTTSLLGNQPRSPTHKPITIDLDRENCIQTGHLTVKKGKSFIGVVGEFDVDSPVVVGNTPCLSISHRSNGILNDFDNPSRLCVGSNLIELPQQQLLNRGTYSRIGSRDASRSLGPLCTSGRGRSHSLDRHRVQGGGGPLRIDGYLHSSNSNIYMNTNELGSCLSPLHNSSTVPLSSTVPAFSDVDGIGFGSFVPLTPNMPSNPGLNGSLNLSSIEHQMGNGGISGNYMNGFPSIANVVQMGMSNGMEVRGPVNSLDCDFADVFADNKLDDMNFGSGENLSRDSKLKKQLNTTLHGVNVLDDSIKSKGLGNHGKISRITHVENSCIDSLHVGDVRNGSSNTGILSGGSIKSNILSHTTRFGAHGQIRTDSINRSNIFTLNRRDQSGRNSTKMIGAYSPKARKKRIARFMKKRTERVWTKRVKYDVRKNFADSRLRVKGRFVKKGDEELLREVMNMA